MKSSNAGHAHAERLTEDEYHSEVVRESVD